MPFTDQETEAQRNQRDPLMPTELVNADTELNYKFDLTSFFLLGKNVQGILQNFKVH